MIIQCFIVPSPLRSNALMRLGMLSYYSCRYVRGIKSTNILYTHVHIFGRLLVPGESTFYVAPYVLDDVEVRRVGWPRKNSVLLFGNPLLRQA